MENTNSVWNVLDYGAVADGNTDNTESFQAALNACYEAGGGTVFVPSGKYMITGSLTVNRKVTLKGAGSAVDGWGQATTLLAVNDREPFIKLVWGGGVQYVHILYPEQAVVPPVKQYPYCISAEGENCHIIGVSLANPYNGISLEGAGRHLVRDVHGNPLNIGLFVDRCYDVGRIENVHFWPFYSGSDTRPTHEEMYRHIQQNGTAFLFGRTDWQYVLNTFCWGYKIGYKFIETETGPCNGNFVGIGADATVNSVVVEHSNKYACGLLITNGEFVPLMAPDSVAVVVEETNRGYVNFNNCSVWGPSDQIAKIAGTGKVSFNSCNIIQWDKNDRGAAAIECSGGIVMLTGNHFGPQMHPEFSSPQVFIRKGTRAAVIANNTSEGKWIVEREPGTTVEMSCNIGG